MREIVDLDWADDPPAAPKVQLRGRQQDWLNAIETDLSTYSRLLAVAPGGVGKSTVFGFLAARFHERGLKSLILENRDRLTRQTADRIAKETGIDVEVEMGSERASPFAPIVVACVQSLSRENRLSGFPDDHFGLVVPDECHFSLSQSWLRILRYFHYGAHSLAPDWKPPPDHTYEPKAQIVGFTATPDIGERRKLSEFYQHRSVNYSYLEAVQDGWLVAPIQKSVPVKIDLRKFKTASGPMGVDFQARDLSAVIAPIIGELAKQILQFASDRKTMAFLPSVECARLLAEACSQLGMPAWFVSGECLDVDEKTEAFIAAGRGSVLANAAIYNAGVDFPDVDCIAWFRATLSRAFYIQGLYRGSRVVLPRGVLEACPDAEARRAAIAQSVKPNFMVLDPLFVSDRIDLLDPYDLFTDKSEVKERMKQIGPASAESAATAERDFIKALEKEAKKHARKQARIIDPLAWAVNIGDDALANYVPETNADSRPPTPGQLGFLQRHRIDTSKVATAGLANKIIGRYLKRLELGLASAEQLSFLKRLGFNDGQTATMTKREAHDTIDRILAEKRG